MIGIAIALIEFNDLRRLVTPTFFQKHIQFTIISTLSKNEKKSMWEVEKNFHGTWNPAILRLQDA